jgi:hypothetical protein
VGIDGPRHLPGWRQGGQKRFFDIGMIRARQRRDAGCQCLVKV